MEDTEDMKKTFISGTKAEQFVGTNPSLNNVFSIKYKNLP